MQLFTVVHLEDTPDGTQDIVDIWEVMAKTAHQAIEYIAEATEKTDWRWFSSSFGLHLHNPQRKHSHGRPTDCLAAYDEG